MPAARNKTAIKPALVQLKLCMIQPPELKIEV